MSNIGSTKSDKKFRHHPITSDQCPDCGSNELIMDDIRGERICSNCGLVIDSNLIDRGQEWRAFTAQEEMKRSRVGSPIKYTIHDKGLSTIIGPEDRDVHGNKLTSRKRAQVYRLRKWQIRSNLHSSFDRNLTRALSELERLSSQLGIPKSIQEIAAVIYRKALKNRAVKRQRVEAKIAAALYAALRISKIPRTLDEIAKVSQHTKKELGKCYRLLIEGIDMDIPLASPIDYLARFGEELKLSVETQKLAIEILKKAKEEGLTGGKDPKGLAAAVIYISGVKNNERRTQKEIAKVAQVTEVTIRNRYKDLVRKLGISISA